MNLHVSEMYEKIRNGSYLAYRTGSIPAAELENIYLTLPPYSAVPAALEKLLTLETPVIIPGERFQFIRTLDGKILPPSQAGRRVENLTPDWDVLLRDGLEKRRLIIRKQLETTGMKEENILFLQAADRMLKADRKSVV